jgi:hypothetical protein
MSGRIEFRDWEKRLFGSPALPSGSRSISGILKLDDDGDIVGEFMTELAAE